MEELNTVLMTAIVPNGRASLAVQMVSAEGTATTAHTTPIVAQGKSAVMAESVRRLALRLRLRLTVLIRAIVTNGRVSLAV